MGSMLRDTAPPAMLTQLHARAGNKAARIEWCHFASAWCNGGTVSEQWRSMLLVPRFTLAASPPS